MFQVFINEVEYDHFCRITKVKFQLKACWTQVILRFSATLFFFFWYSGIGNFKCKGRESLWWFIDVFICQFPTIKNRAALLAFNSIDTVVVKCRRRLESLAATTASNWNLRSLEYICLQITDDSFAQQNPKASCGVVSRKRVLAWVVLHTRDCYKSNENSNKHIIDDSSIFTPTLNSDGLQIICLQGLCPSFTILITRKKKH